MCVTKATIIGVTNGSVVDADTAVRCTADDNAYPSADYLWVNHVDGSQATGPQFVLRPGNEYKLNCHASNNFRKCYATDYVEFSSKSTLYSSVFSLMCSLQC